MTESELLTAIAGTYKSVAQSPTTEWDQNDAGVTKRNVQIFTVDEEQNPPTGEIGSVSYYVFHIGQANESAYLPSGVTLAPVAEISASVQAKNVKLEE